MPERNFGWALEQLESGERVQREEWNGKGMWIALVDDWSFGGELVNWFEKLPEVSSFIAMKTADNKFVPWTVSQTDVLAKDWQFVGEAIS